LKPEARDYALFLIATHLYGAIEMLAALQGNRAAGAGGLAQRHAGKIVPLRGVQQNCSWHTALPVHSASAQHPFSLAGTGS
jgi:hypothetical protein